MLWKKLKADDFDTDIIEVLREGNQNIEQQLEGLTRTNISEVFLFFDYDNHQNNLGSNETRDVIEQMLENFDNETENGKLYISYPMAEALRDFKAGTCGDKSSCYLKGEDIAKYKNISAIRSNYSQFKTYKFDTWQEIINIFIMKLFCLLNQKDNITFEQYQNINPLSIYKLERRISIDKEVFILSAFPEFLLDYFGINLWRKCVKKSSSYFIKCNNN